MEIPELTEIMELLSNWQDRLLQRARAIKDDSIEKAAQPSDIANVRDVAMDASISMKSKKSSNNNKKTWAVEST
eukprot:12183492-Karenia_brevis.AAC.1